MTEPVDLSNCDREPIHIPASIQPHGAMLVTDISGEQLLSASANIASITGYKGNLIPGMSISSIVGDNNAHNFRNAAAKARNPGQSSVVLGVRFPGKSALFDAVIHTSSGKTFIEIEPCSDQGQSAKQALDLTRSVIQRVGRAENITDVAATGVRLVRAMLGYDRVMLYRFLHNGAGRVIAEAKSAALGSFMGQHFPASDIPAQARHLYSINTIRMISDTSYHPVPLSPPVLANEPIDMSFAQLRSVSPIHCQYLRNMGVSASLSISIVIDGELWGLISCHHDKPKTTPLPLRIGAELFGQYFSLHIADCERRAKLKATTDARAKLDMIVSQLGISDEISQGLGEQLAHFPDLISSDGVALWINGQWLRSGDTLNRHQTRQLLETAAHNAPREVWATNQITKELKTYEGSIAGMLAIPLSMAFEDYLVLFRNEEAHAIEWAGEPIKIVDTNLVTRLTPRGSFDTWLEEVRGRSLPWNETDMSVAQSIGTYLRDVILRRNELAEQERTQNEQRRQILNAELNHRVKNILSVVKSIVLQTGANAATVTEYAEVLEGRLRALASAHDQSLNGTKGGLLTDLLKAEAGLYCDTNIPGRVFIEGPPVRMDNRAFGVFSLVVHEMMTNAAKYGALSVFDGSLNISWQLDDCGDCTLCWREIGGPLVEKPSKTGFGSKLIRNSLEYDLRGKAEIEYHEEGLVASFVVPAEHVVLEAGSTPIPTVDTKVAVELDLNGRTVLIIEDQNLIALDLEETLRKFGAGEVRLASNAGDAIRVLETVTPHLAILDFNLGGDTSEDVAVRLLKLNVPFIFTTGYTDIEYISNRFQKTVVIQKPVNDTDFAAAVSSLI